MLIGNLGTGGFFLSSLSSACLVVGEKDSDLALSGYNTYIEIIPGWKHFIFFFFFLFFLYSSGVLRKQNHSD